MAINQQQLEKTGIYESNAPLPGLVSDLEEIGKVVEGAAAAKKSRTKMGCFTVLGGLAGVLVGLAFTPLLVISGLVAIGGFVWWIVSMTTGRKLTAHRGRLDIAKERITALQHDSSAKAPFSFRLALASNPIQTSQEPWHGRKNGNQQFFEETWFSLEGPLLDGTVLSDEIKDLTRKRTYSNPRGKRKTKNRLTHLVSVRFSYPQELYGDARPAGQALENQLKVGPSSALRSVRVTEKAVVLKALVTAEKEIGTTVGMLSLGGYRILNLARRAAGQRGNTK